MPEISGSVIEKHWDEFKMHVNGISFSFLTSYGLSIPIYYYGYDTVISANPRVGRKDTVKPSKKFFEVINDTDISIEDIEEMDNVENFTVVEEMMATSFKHAQNADQRYEFNSYLSGKRRKDMNIPPIEFRNHTITGFEVYENWSENPNTPNHALFTQWDDEFETMFVISNGRGGKRHILNTLENDGRSKPLSEQFKHEYRKQKFIPFYTANTESLSDGETQIMSTLTENDSLLYPEVRKLLFA